MPHIALILAAHVFNQGRPHHPGHEFRHQPIDLERVKDLKERTQWKNASIAIPKPRCIWKTSQSVQSALTVSTLERS
jgi:hypothetical protein